MRKSTTRQLTACLLIATTALTGCEATKQAEDTRIRANTAYDDARTRLPIEDANVHSTIRVRKTPFFGDRAIRSQHGDSLPDDLERSTGVVFVASRYMSLQEVASELATRTGVRINIGNLSGPDQTTNAGALTDTAKLDYSGSLSGFLDVVANRYGTDWTYTNGAVSLYRYDTRTFVVYALGTDSTTTASVSSEAKSSVGATGGGTSGGVSGNSGASQSTQATSTLKPWTELADTIKAVLPKGSGFSPSPSSGTLTITAPPYVLDQVASMIDAFNARSSRQVEFDVQIIALQDTSGDDYAIDVQAVFENAGLAFRSLSGVSGLASAVTGSLGFSVISNQGSAGKYNGSTVAARALAKLGSTTSLYSNTVVTQNNRAAPATDQVTQSYAASTQQTTIANAGTTSGTTPGNVTTGLQLSLLPRILSGGRLLLQVSISISELLELTNFTSGGTTIQLPKTASKDFFQTLGLTSGETLMIAGFDHNTALKTQTGTFFSILPLPTGSTLTNNTHSRIVVLITPRVTESPLARSYQKAAL